MCDGIEVCVCKNICIQEILEAIKSGVKTIVEAIKSGVKTINDIQERTGAGTVCKMCVSSEYDPYGERAVHISELLKNV